MDLATLARVIRGRAELRAHDQWSRDQLLAHQARSLRALRSYAVARSPFYRDLHRGLDDAPLDALPIVTKAMLMERFDDLVTGRDIRLADVEAYLEGARVTDRFRGRYRVQATGGTTGRRGVFLADPAEWRAIIVSYTRSTDFAGVAPAIGRPVRQGVVTSRHPSHQSSIVGATAGSRLVMPTLRLDATDPLDEIVDGLNRFRPQSLIGYVSMLRILADEQRAGRLAIQPRAIITSSEVLPDETRARIETAFGVAPTSVYAATETGVIASECRHGKMHRYEDLVITEVVDEDNQPAAFGTYGARLLVTVLFSRTQPLIRYELSDRVRERDGGCEDGRPYALFGGIEGREEEVLTLAGVTVVPNVFHVALERLPVAGWQVIEEAGSLRVLLARPPEALDEGIVIASVADALARVGARGVQISVERVPDIPRTSLGKAPLVRRGG